MVDSQTTVEQRKGTRRITIPKSNKAFEMRRFDPEGRGSCGDIGGAAFKAAICAFAFTYAAPVVAKDRITQSGKMRRQSCLSGMRAAADFVAAADN